MNNAKYWVVFSINMIFDIVARALLYGCRRDSSGVLRGMVRDARWISLLDLHYQQMSTSHPHSKEESMATLMMEL